MDTIAMRLYNTIEVGKRNPDCCRTVIGMYTETRVALKSRIKYKLNLALVIIKNAQGGYLALNQIKIMGEALLRGKAEPGSSQCLLQDF